jgi:hypothetical protein
MISGTVMWIDPGKDTGIAVWHPAWNKPAIWELEFEQAGDYIEYYCQAAPVMYVGWETFRITPTTPPDDAHHAIEMIGVTRRAALKSRCTILTPAAPGQRRVATPEMLKALGWWVPGKDDAQSAAQHLLAWLLRGEHLPAREAGILAGLRSRSGG